MLQSLFRYQHDKRKPRSANRSGNSGKERQKLGRIWEISKADTKEAVCKEFLKKWEAVESLKNLKIEGIVTQQHDNFIDKSN